MAEHEHTIRLRGGWEWSEPDADTASAAPGGTGRRVTLPLAWPAGVARKVRLVRSFQRPPFDPARETLLLRLASVPGLLSIRLNGRVLTVSPGVVLIPLDEPLAPRNVLVLEVEPPGPADTGSATPRWGEFALVIRPLPEGERDPGVERSDCARPGSV